ncbi:MAG: restriction endonuclease [Tepidisphaeraceae bacterium]
MSIWEYSSTSPVSLTGYAPQSSDFSLGSAKHWQERRPCCRYCGSPLAVFHDGAPNLEGGDVMVCNTCGWWLKYDIRTNNAGPDDVWADFYAAAGALRNLDLTDVTVPLSEVRSYLLARYSDRIKLPPKRCEDLVGSVFAEFGYQVRVTSFSGDKGIDVFVFDGPNGECIGVQVKRYSGKIEAEQIRSFVGALYSQRLTKGIFVTTSSYRPGAISAAQDSCNAGIPVILWDAETFYDRMRILQRAPYESLSDPSASFAALSIASGLPHVIRVQIR